MVELIALLVLTVLPNDSVRPDVERVIVAQRAEDAKTSPDSKKKAAGKPAEAAKAARDKKTTDLEASVLPMVDNHLPDLKVLLDRLRKNQPRLYETAIRDLSRYSKRLESAKKRGEEAFELELEVVKAQSSANLLIARLRVRDSKKDRDSLRKATQQIHEAELAKLRFDHDQLVERLKRMQKQVDASAKRLETQESKDADSINKTYTAFLRKAGKKPNKPTSKTPAPNDKRP